MKRLRRWAFTVGVTAASRAFRLRDRLSGFEQAWAPTGERVWIASGSRRLAATWVAADGETAPVVLICHGIGETVDGWAGVQAYLRERGIGSLVFDYSGYGRSSGWIASASCEEDLAAVYAEVRHRASTAPVFVLGFSLGSGIAAHGAALLKPRIAGLVLCESFPSFREAARASGVPQWMSGLVPEIWDSVGTLQERQLPVLAVHSDADRLFPLEMGRRVAKACGSELLVVHGYHHDDLYRRPDDGYWSGIVEWIREQTGPGQVPVQAGIE